MKTGSGRGAFWKRRLPGYRDRGNSKTDLSRSTKGEVALDVLAIGASSLPYLGGPLSQILGRVSGGYKWKRAESYLREMDVRLEEASEASKEYVTRPEFVDLLEQTLRRLMDEASEQRRQMFTNVLEEAIRGARPVDEASRVIRLLDRLDPIHVHALHLVHVAAQHKRKGVLRALFRIHGALHDDELGQALSVTSDEAQAIASVLEGQGLVIPPLVRGFSPAWRITDLGNRVLQYLRSDFTEKLDGPT